MPMNSHYVGGRFCTRIGPRTCAEARGSKEGKNPIINYYHAVEVSHEMKKQLILGLRVYVLDMKQLPKVARLRCRAETLNYPFVDRPRWPFWSNGTSSRPHKIILRFRANFREMKKCARVQKKSRSKRHSKHKELIWTFRVYHHH